AAARGAGTAVTLGLANPAGALALGAVGVLIVLHLYGRRRRAVPVGTLFLWQRVPAEPLDRRRFRPDLLFALQLGLLLALIAGHPRAQDRLEALEPLDTPTNLVAALELALGERRARPETQVAVLTDLPREASGVARAELAYVDWVQIGRSDDNVAITGLSVDAPPFHPAGDATATVLVRNYAHVERRVVLEARVGTETWARRELVLAPRGA